MSETETDPVTGTETTGHEWDGIKELDNPLPRWWLWTFYATIIWAFGYAIAYPALPFVGDAFGGLLGYSSRASLHEAVADANAAQAEQRGKLETLSLDEIRLDAAAFQFAVNGGRAAYAVNCSQCHGSGASGGPGYPNLNDDVWLWGGTLDAIYTTLKHGIRFEQDDDTRFSLMPAFGSDQILDRDQMRTTTHFVRSLSGLPHDQALAKAGAPVFEENCAACHMEDGSGDREQGAPNLKDAIWHFGSSHDEIYSQIANPGHGMMPGWKDRLDDVTLKQLAVYVHSLGGGE